MWSKSCINMVSIGFAFLAGLASFLTPCVFSLVPVYIGYLGGRSLSSGEAQSQNKFETFRHGLFFVLGFTLVFFLLGVAVSTLRAVLFELTFWLVRVGGIIVIVFGLHMTGLIRIPFLYYDLRPRMDSERKRSYLTSFLMGVFFSAGWSPCVGPILATILALAVNSATFWAGAGLLLVYSAGMAIPFLAAALGIGWVSRILRKYGSALRYVEIGLGVVMIVVGLMLFLGTFQQLKSLGTFIDFGL